MSYLSSLSVETLTTYLTEAQDALHKVMIGNHVGSISRAGRTVSYSSTDKNNLIRYINDLEDAISLKSGGSNKGRFSSGVLY